MVRFCNIAVVLLACLLLGNLAVQGGDPIRQLRNKKTDHHCLICIRCVKSKVLTGDEMRKFGGNAITCAYDFTLVVLRSFEDYSRNATGVDFRESAKFCAAMFRFAEVAMEDASAYWSFLHRPYTLKALREARTNHLQCIANLPGRIPPELSKQLFRSKAGIEDASQVIDAIPV